MYTVESMTIFSKSGLFPPGCDPWDSEGGRVKPAACQMWREANQ